MIFLSLILINETIVLETAAGGALKRLSRIDPGSEAYRDLMGIIPRPLGRSERVPIKYSAALRRRCLFVFEMIFPECRSVYHSEIVLVISATHSSAILFLLPQHLTTINFLFCYYSGNNLKNSETVISQHFHICKSFLTGKKNIAFGYLFRIREVVQCFLNALFAQQVEHGINRTIGIIGSVIRC